MMCSRCKKRPAVMFISTMSAGERKSEGLCLNCAKEMGLPQVNEYLQQMGISEEDFDNAVDSIFGEDGSVDPDMLKQFGIGDDDDDEDESGDPDSSERDEDNLFRARRRGHDAELPEKPFRLG